MKRLIVLIALATVAFSAAAQGKFKLTGRTIDESGQPVSYATVVLLNGNDEQVVGASSTAEGHFELSASKGNYKLMVTFIGFESHTQPITLDGNIDLGSITLAPSSQEIDAVVITEHVIRRESDRFIVTVANNPLSSGKDAFEMLRTAPGVWTSKSTGITINGQSGTRIMIDDRILDLSGEDLEAYLHSLPASDIARIEVIPSSGAEYSADSSGGIIKFIMVKKRTSGIEGNVGIRGGWSPYNNTYRVSPNGRINYYQDKLNLYTQLGYNNGNHINESYETTDYTNGSKLISDSKNVDTHNRYNATIGGVYDLTAKSSIGAEFTYFGSDEYGRTDAYAIFNITPTHITRDTSNYDNGGNSSYFGTSVNYILKLDDKGSTFKVLGDWNGNIGTNNNRYNTQTYIDNGGVFGRIDTLYRNISSSRYNVYSLGADVELINSASRSIKFGAKYTRNEMYANQLYEYYDGADWEDNDSNQPTDYNEDIGAIYGIYNQKFGLVSASLGLRGEYTNYNPKYTDLNSGETTEFNKSYIDIFPTLTINVPFSQTQTHILIGNFSRRINRPGFWALNPFRMQLSEYSYIVGNPNLKPMYSNNAFLTYVYKYRYTLTFGAQFLENQVQQVISQDSDSDNPNALMYRFENIPMTRQYFVSLNAPFVINDWWSVNANGFFMMQEQKLRTTDEFKYNPMGMLSLSSSFILPKKWEIEASFWGMTNIMQANMSIAPMYSLELNVTKRVGKWILGASLSNMLQRSMTMSINEESFKRTMSLIGNNGNFMTIGLSVRYNFNAGVKFRARTVESGTDENRMGGGSGVGSVSAPAGNQ